MALALAILWSEGDPWGTWKASASQQIEAMTTQLKSRKVNIFAIRDVSSIWRQLNVMWIFKRDSISLSSLSKFKYLSKKKWIQTSELIVIPSPEKIPPSATVYENYYKCCIWIFPPIFVLLKLTCLVTLLDRKLQVFKSSPKWTIFGIFNYLLFTQNVNVARFARNVEEWDFFCEEN